MPPLLPVTKALVLICVGLFSLFFLLPPTYQSIFMLWPVQSGRFEAWQLLTYAFLHANVAHLFFNMFGLTMFGNELEQTLGRPRYLLLLLASTLSAALVQLAIPPLFGGAAPTVGASGALFGLLLGQGMMFPDRIVEPVFPSIPMKVKYFVFIFGALELVLGLGGATGVAHFAHLGGMVGAWVLLRYWRRRRR